MSGPAGLDHPLACSLACAATLQEGRVRAIPCLDTRAAYHCPHPSCHLLSHLQPTMLHHINGLTRGRRIVTCLQGLGDLFIILQGQKTVRRCLGAYSSGRKYAHRCLWGRPRTIGPLCSSNSSTCASLRTGESTEAQHLTGPCCNAMTYLACCYRVSTGLCMVHSCTRRYGP